MSDEVNQRRQCACSAFFLTSDALNTHLQEYLSRQRYLSAELEKCRTHSQANGNDQDSDDDDPESDDDGKEGLYPARNNNAKGLYCPYRGCKRTKPFPKRQALRRHFQIHVKCNEVCVCCFKVFTLASTYLRHADKHPDASSTKSTYTSQICNELLSLVENELDLAENSKKRSWEVTDIDSRSGAQRPKSDVVDMAIIDHSNFQHALSHTQSATPTEPATTLMPLSNVAESVAISGFTNTSAEGFYPKSTEGSTVALDDLNFDAPVNTLINFPPAWAGWVSEDHGTGYLRARATAYNEQ